MLTYELFSFSLNARAMGIAPVQRDRGPHVYVIGYQVCSHRELSKDIPKVPVNLSVETPDPSAWW